MFDTYPFYLVIRICPVVSTCELHLLQEELRVLREINVCPGLFTCRNFKIMTTGMTDRSKLYKKQVKNGSDLRQGKVWALQQGFRFAEVQKHL